MYITSSGENDPNDYIYIFFLVFLNLLIFKKFKFASKDPMIFIKHKYFTKSSFTFVHFI